MQRLLANSRRMEILSARILFRISIKLEIPDHLGQNKITNFDTFCEGKSVQVVQVV